ncbi:hypothetical protein EG329_014092 [Mollisiaceae sp. DMI_Dod_QoI]|nr:hypothetical protein EG329_014092 [Helotiales sp. DMI_Dod_QoI]
MSTSTPTQPPSSSSTPTSTNMLDDPSRAALIHNVSWGALIVCPILIAVPPRKLDIYTLALLTGTFLGGNQLSREYTGISMVQRLQNRLNSFHVPELPPKALETQKRLKEEKEFRERRRLGLQANEDLARRQEAELKAGVLEEVERKRIEDAQKARKDAERTVLEKVWMGSEGADWKAKRDQREKEALEDGRGYGGLIMDQIWEVWNWGKDKNEEVKEIDEKVVAERKAKDTEEKR